VSPGFVISCLTTTAMMPHARAHVKPCHALARAAKFYPLALDKLVDKPGKQLYAAVKCLFYKDKACIA
jgi:hypothetical protein